MSQHKPHPRCKKDFTLSDMRVIRTKIRSIAKIEDSISEKQLRYQLYQLGVFAYRQFMKAGYPVDVNHPALSAPRIVWDKVNEVWCDERELTPA